MWRSGGDRCEKSDALCTFGALARRLKRGHSYARVGHVTIWTSPHGPPGPAPFPGMVWIPGGTFRMGSEDHYPEERPVHRVTVDGFWMDRTPVTNRCSAVRGRDRARHVRRNSAGSRRLPGSKEGTCSIPVRWCSSEAAGPGRPARFPQLVAVRAWAPTGVIRAAAIHDQGPRGSPGRACRLRRRRGLRRVGGKALPTEAEWEFAARGGLDGAEYAWGDDSPDGKLMANFWQGEFPWQNLKERRLRGHVAGRGVSAERLRPVDMTGNVWEWTTDWYTPRSSRRAIKACCVPQNPRGGPPRPRATIRGSRNPDPAQGDQRRLASVRAELLPPLPAGGAVPEPIDTSTCHVGFRCIVRPTNLPRGCVGNLSNDHVSEIVRAWSVLFLRGICNVLFAFVAFLQPGLTLVALVLLWGVYAVFDGATSLTTGVAARRSGGHPWSLMLSGASGLVAGTLRACGPAIPIALVLTIISVGHPSRRTRDLGRHPVSSHPASCLAAGGLWRRVDPFGALLVVRPAIGLVTLVYLVGGAALAFGTVAIAMALHLRRLAADEGTTPSKLMA